MTNADHAIRYPDIMKSKFRLWIFLLFMLAAGLASAQTNLSNLLQQGMFEEEANHNLPAAMADYQKLAAQFDRDRQLAAAGIFRLGECYREEGNTNEAALEYHRIIREFPDQTNLMTLSQEDLAGMGIAPSLVQEATGNSAALAAGANPSVEASNLASEISGIESLKSDPEEEARAVLAIFPAESAELQKMLANLPRLREQEATLRGNPHSTFSVFAIGPDGNGEPFNQQLRELLDTHSTNHLADANMELQQQISLIQDQVNFILEVQKARLKVLQATAGPQQPSQETNQNSASNHDEDQEIARIQAMLQNSPDLINAPDAHGHTPLENAAINGSVKVAAFLLVHGADVNAGKFSALNLAANAGNRTMVEFLLNHGANINARAWTGETPLHTAASDGYKAVAETLLEHKADLNAQDNYGATPLLEAAQNGHPETVQLLLNAGADPNIANNEGRTPLSFAAEADSPEMVKAFLAAKADPNAGTMDAPLLCAVDKDSLACAEFLLQAGANPDVDELMHCPQHSYGSRWYNEFSAILRKATPLWLAIQNHQLPMVQLLLKYKAHPDSEISEPPPVIFWSLSDTDTNILRALLDAGADSNITNGYGRTPLSDAAVSGLTNAEKLLLAAKADPNGGPCDAPLLCAINKDDTASVQLLLAAGADPNSEGYAPDLRHNGNNQATPLWTAVTMDEFPMVQLLLKYKANPNDSRINHQPLIFSALSNPNILEELLDAGAKVDARDSTDMYNGQPFNWTPLLLAVKENLPANTVEILLKHGADPNAQDSVFRKTPLLWTTGWFEHSPDWSTLELLLADKANPNLPDANGQTLLDKLKHPPGGLPLEQKASLKKCADLLRRYGALDVLPDWDHITVSLPSGDHSSKVFSKGTNNWNQFTLLDTIFSYYEYASGANSFTTIAGGTGFPFNPGITFPNLAKVTIVRPHVGTTNVTRIKINLLDQAGQIDSSKDILLRFGDTVEIAQREHTLSESDTNLMSWLPQISGYLRNKAGSVRLIVDGGQTIQIPLAQFGPLNCYIGPALRCTQAQNVLTSNSNLSHVKVSRRNWKAKGEVVWTLDCTAVNNLRTGGGFNYVREVMGMSSSPNYDGCPDLLLRDGDIITVPDNP